MSNRKNIDMDTLEYLTNKEYPTSRIAKLMNVSPTTIKVRQQELEIQRLKDENENLKNNSKSIIPIKKRRTS